ncbi:MAG: hypothetical protein HC905_02785 [Bacteroidales bacterium]|nr:hypothetical protein [Bacteroidales bacterium]
MITIGSRYFIAFMNLALIILCSRYLGAEGLGFISLFVLGLALNNQVCSFFGGSALVYLAPRKNLATLIFISYTGATIMHMALVPLYLWLKPFDIVYFPEFFIISLMNVYFSTNLSLLLGKEKVETYNVLSVFQILLQVLIFGLFVYKLEKISVNHYIIASIISYFMAMAGSAGILMNNIPRRTEELFQTIKEIFKYGFLLSREIYCNFWPIV